MRRAKPLLLITVCLLVIAGVAASAWFAYDARRQANETRDEIASLSSEIVGVQDAIDRLNTSGGDGSAATVDDVSSAVDDVQSSVDDLSSSVETVSSSVDDLQSSVDALASTLDDVSSTVDNVCFALANC